MTKFSKYEQYQYITAFIREKTRQGIRQHQIAKSIGKSNTYVSWLVLDKRKNKCIDKQTVEKIANFFNMTTSELLQAGKKIHDKKNQKSKKDNNIIEIHLHIYLDGADHDVVAA